MAYNIPYDTDYSEWYGTPQNVNRLSATLEQTKNEDGEPIGRITASWDVPDNGGVFNVLLSTDDTNYKLKLLNVSGNSAIMDVEPDTGYYVKVVTVLGGNQSTGTVLQVSVATIPTPSAPTLTALSDGFQIDVGVLPSGYTVQLSISDGTNTEVIGSAESVTMYLCDEGNYSVTVAYVDINGNVGTSSAASTVSVSGTVSKDSSDYIKSASVSGNTLTLTKGNNDTVDYTPSDFVGSGANAASGLVPAPPTTAGTTKFLREDGSWQVPAGGGGGGGTTYTSGDGIDITNDVISLKTASSNDIGGVKVGTNLSVDANGVLNATDTTYSDFVGSGSSAHNGLVPAPPNTAGTTKYLREDGSWEVPAGGSSYTLPIASANDLGGIKVGNNLSIDANGVLSAIGGGGGGTGNASGVTSEELFSNSSGVNSGTIALSSGLSNYDFIAFSLIRSGYSNEYINLVPVSEVVRLSSSTSGGAHLSIFGYDTDSINLYYTNDTTLTILGYTGLAKVSKVFGIKISKNLTEQMSEVVLYNNDSGWNSGEITLNDTWKNYDILNFVGARPSESPTSSNPYITQSFLTVSQVKLQPIKYLLYNYDNRYMTVSFTGDTTLTAGNNNDFKIYKITGIKLAQGGYSGIVTDARMTVKSGTIWQSSNTSGEQLISVAFDSPMPDTNYQVSVTYAGDGGSYWTTYDGVTDKTVNGFKIRYYTAGRTQNVPKFDWIAIRPNSYTREGMVEDVLFSNSSGVNSGTINLSGNISDYDLIEFEVNRSGAGYLNETVMTFPSSVLTTLTGTTGGSKHASIVGYADDYINFYYNNDNSLVIINAKSLKIVKIKGIKFGRYVSGVAVDTTVTQGSQNVVTSGAVYNTIAALEARIQALENALNA